MDEQNRDDSKQTPLHTIRHIISSKTRIATNDGIHSPLLRVVHGRRKETRFAHIGLPCRRRLNARTQHANTHRHVQPIVGKVLVIELLNRSLGIPTRLVHNDSSALRLTPLAHSHLELVLRVHIHLHGHEIRNQPKQLHERILVERGVETAHKDLRRYTSRHDPKPNKPQTSAGPARILSKKFTPRTYSEPAAVSGAL